MDAFLNSQHEEHPCRHWTFQLQAKGSAISLPLTQVSPLGYCFSLADIPVPQVTTYGDNLAVQVNPPSPACRGVTLLPTLRSVLRQRQQPSHEVGHAGWQVV